MGPTFCRVLAVAVLIITTGHIAHAQNAPSPLEIIRITPEGKDVAATRQIVLEFNRPVVPLGQMDRTADEVGITITPALECQWRWLNTSALSCNLDEKSAMALATTYSLHVEPKIQAEDGGTLSTSTDHTFTTQRASIGSAYIQTWTKPGTPVFRISFSQPTTKKSVQDHVYYREAIGEQKRFAVKVEKAEDDESEPYMVGRDEARSIWMVSPSKEMPGNSAILLEQEAGLISAEGPEASEEHRQIKQFYTYPPITFKSINCRNALNEEVKITPDSAQSPENLCNPLQPVSVSFSAPVLRSVVKDAFVFTPDLAGGRTDYNPWGDENRDWSRLNDERADAEPEYTIGLPFGLKAAQEYSISVPAASKGIWGWIKSLFAKDKTEKTLLVDEFGRSLPPFTIKFSTGHRNPNYEMVYRDAVLEKNIDSDVPLYVNNLQSHYFEYEAITTTGFNRGKTAEIEIPAVQDKQFAVPLNIRKILKGQSGALYGGIHTTPYVNKWDGAGRLFVQVTPYQIYTKLGHFQSSVWVTDLESGNVVPNARVNIYKGQLTNLQNRSGILATATTDENGIAILPGTEKLDPDMSLLRSYQDDSIRLFVGVEKGTDMALLPITYDYEVQLWNVATDVYTSPTEKYGHMKAWGMTAQGIYRAGDTMQYKIYVRDQDNNRFVSPPSGTYAVDISDPTGKSVQRVENVSVSEFGTISGEYSIPKNASVGWYNVKLETTLKVAGKDVKKEFYPLSVLVSDFTPAPFRVGTELNGTHFKAGDNLSISSDAKLHSGGAYADATIRSTVTLKGKTFTSNDKAAQNFTFDSFEGENDTEELLQKEDKLNDKGEWETSLTLPEKPIVFGQLRVESAVRDDRGKSIANEARADYAGVDRLVGLKPKEWVFTAKQPSIIQTIVVDDKGAPAEKTSVSVVIEREDVSTAKVKSAGNAYLNDNTVTWTKVSDCSLKSSKEAQDCTFTPESAGTYRAVATIKDTKGREHKTTETIWVSGSDYVQWNEGKEYALTIMPEKQDYKVGDTARYLVKNPYPGAMAYISIERYGVIDNFVQKLEGSTPIIEFPVKADYLPGFYLSIVAVSPRVESPPVDSSQIDLGKPAFRVGYVKVPVLDPYKEMVVTAKAEQEIYRPRDMVKVDLDARPRHDNQTNDPVELAVAVLDESVFDLISDGRNAYDVYKGFYDLEYLDVSNYSLLTRLVGRQKFEKKGANAGGDGGIDTGMRNLFKFVSYWNPSVPVDANGKAQIEFEAPDNLTGWRILAIATTKNDLMGLGDANFKVNRPTEVRPVMPNQVREGDEFSAGFSVMNRTDTPRTIKVNIEATGDLDGKRVQTKEQSVTLEPYKRTTVLFPLKTALLPVAREFPEGTISFRVTAGDDEDSDGMEHSLPVLKSRTFDTAANYATTTEDSVSENLTIPKDIYTDSGDVSVVLSPTVIAGLDGAFRYMRDYIYPCWEQKLSVATMASHYKNLKPYLSVEWNSAQNITQDILNIAAEYQAPNGGMAYYKANDDYADPYLSAYTALSFSWLKKSGHTVPKGVEDKLHTYLLNFLRNNAAPDYYQQGMTSTVRAVILSALKDSGKITKEDILRFKPHVKEMSLFGKANYMQAAQSFDETQSTARDTLGMILSSGVETGGKFSFNETYDDGYSRILATPLRDNCAILTALVESPDKRLVGDKPFKLVRMITQGRGNRDHWENTQENMFCMNALVNYAAVYESEEPDMEVTAALNGKEFGKATFEDVKDVPITVTESLDEKDAGSKSILKISREGDGRLYYSTRLRYALKDLTNSVNAGIDVKREYSIQKDKKWSLVEDEVSIKRGDLVKVDLYVSIPTARNFVVVNDPLPGGLETVNRDLATSSNVDADQGLFDESGGSYWFKFDDWQEFNASRWSFYHKELRHDSARFYADWLEPGNYHLSYIAQAVATGTFSIPPTVAEEMYDPNVYGRGNKGELIVEETP